MKDLDQAIRERAYHLWMESGCQDGQSDHYWLVAQREILNASLGEIAVAKTETQAAKPKKASAKAKAPRKKRAA